MAHKTQKTHIHTHNTETLENKEEE